MKTEGKWTALADAAMLRKELVQIKAGSSTSPAEVETLGANDTPIGINEFAVSTAGDEVTVEPLHGGTRECVALSALTVGAEFESGASGKIHAVTSGPTLGMVKEAAAADDDIVEVVFY